MECRDVEKLIDAWWDRELDVRTSSEIEAHVATCPVCAAGYGAVNALLTRPQPASAPPGLRDRVLGAVLSASRDRGASGVETGGEHEAPAPIILPRPWIGAVAACLVLLMTGLITWQRVRGPEGGANQGSQPLAAVRPLPSVIAPLTQLMVLGTPFNPAPAMVQAVALQQIVEPQCRMIAEMPKRDYLRDVPQADPSPVMPEISVIFAGLSLGA